MSAKESPHIISLRNQDKLNRLATERFRVADGKVKKYKAATPAKNSETVVAAAIAAEKRARHEAYANMIARAKIGDVIEGRGILLGEYAPKDRDGNSLGMIFNVFAAPQDLPAKSYPDTVKCLAGMKNWHGHDGEGYATDKEFYEALKSGVYNGGWVIPTRDILQGRDAEDNPSTPDNILAHMDTGAFKDTFVKVAGIWRPDGYWSCTELSASIFNKSYVVYLGHDVTSGWSYKDARLHNCRPVRLEPKP